MLNVTPSLRLGHIGSLSCLLQCRSRAVSDSDSTRSFRVIINRVTSRVTVAASDSLWHGSARVTPTRRNTASLRLQSLWHTGSHGAVVPVTLGAITS